MLLFPRLPKLKLTKQLKKTKKPQEQKDGLVWGERRHRSHHTQKCKAANEC